MPGGFLFVFFGLLGLVFSGLFGYAGWLAFDKEVLQKQTVPYHYGYLFGASAMGLILLVALIYFGIKVALDKPDFKL